MEVTMCLLKFHGNQEFHDFKISEDIALLKQYVEKRYGSEARIVRCSDFYQVIVDEEEIGCIGPIEQILQNNI